MSSLSNSDYTGYDSVVASGTPSAGGGVVAVKGNGAIEFTSEATAIDRREQGQFVYEDCETNAVVLELAASRFNSLLTSNATWDTQNDRWNKNGSQSIVVDNTSDSVNGVDIDIMLAFSELKAHYENNELNGSNDKTAVNDTVLASYFSTFEADIKANVLVNGGEVLFTDETLVGTEFTAEDLASTIRYASSASSDLSDFGMDVLGDSADVTSGAGDTGTIAGSTNVAHTTDTLKVLEINEMLRKMMDIGYNNRAASGSGGLTGSGADGLIDQSPFKAGDIFFFENGFGIDAKVLIDDELHEDQENLLDGDETAITGITASTTGITYTKAKHSSNLFIVLV